MAAHLVRSLVPRGPRLRSRPPRGPRGPRAVPRPAWTSSPSSRVDSLVPRSSPSTRVDSGSGEHTAPFRPRPSSVILPPRSRLARPSEGAAAQTHRMRCGSACCASRTNPPSSVLRAPRGAWVRRRWLPISIRARTLRFRLQFHWKLFGKYTQNPYVPRELNRPPGKNPSVPWNLTGNP